MNLRKQFAEPGPEYRSAPFWSWNDDLDPDEIRRQLEEMKRGGYGGAFFHSRQGLITPYLGKAWDRAIDAAVKCSRRLGLPAYLYDEDRWPSGFAGNKATRKHRNHMKRLTARRGRNGRLVLSVEPFPPIEYFNNTPYLDTLKKEAVGDFIRSTYDHYAATQGKAFGRAIPAIFTDEPSYYRGSGDGSPCMDVPYTDALPERFRQRYGYDLAPLQACLFERTGPWAQVRYDYWNLISELFRENYFGQIYHWCEARGIALTGHNLEEDTIQGQIRYCGPVMPIFEYEHIPGVDKLRRTIEHPLTIKQCASAANQLGRPRVLSEIFGGCGQNMSFLDRKWIGDWSLALGVNLFCPHLALYSMAGCRKRDYPPTLSWQQPWWADNKPLEDHFARCSFLLSQGRYSADLLVLHPIESGFLLFEPGHEAHGREILELQASFDAVLAALWRGHIEFDLGDEVLLARHGRVDGAEVKVGRMTYRAVALPPMRTMRATTLALLEAFHQAGGTIFRASTLPDHVDGRADPRAAAFLRRAAKVYETPAHLCETCERKGLRPVRIREGACDAVSVLLHRRLLSGGRQAIFLVNTDRERACDIELSMEAKGRVEGWDTWTGATHPVAAEATGKGTRIPVPLPPAGSALYILHTRAKPAAGAPARPARETLVARSDLDGWKARPLGPNSLVLDRASVRDKGGRWSEPMPLWRIQQRLEAGAREGDPVAVRFAVETDFSTVPDGICLVTERPEQFRIAVNGQPVPRSAERGAWLDVAFRKLAIGCRLRPRGLNEILLETRYRKAIRPHTLIYRKGGTELESVFLLGDFAVRGEIEPVGDGHTLRAPVLTDAEPIGPRDVTPKGYPFYAGRFLFSGTLDLPAVRKGERLLLELDEPRAISFRVRVNRRPVGPILVPPYRVDITGAAREGANRMEIEAASSLRNLLGPHHHTGGESLTFVAPRHFEDVQHWTDDLHVVPLGLRGVRVFARVSSRSS